MIRAGGGPALRDGRIFIALLVLIAWLPLPLGSNQPWSWGLLEVAAFGLLSLWLLLRARAAVPSAGLRENWGVLLLLGLWLGYHLLQVLPLPPEVLGFLSPAAAEVYRHLPAQGANRFLTLSLDPGLTLYEFLKAAAYVAVFILVLVLVNTRTRVQQLFYLLIFVVLAEAIWAIVDLYPFVLGKDRWATGTYVNANHFAGLLEMGIPLTIGLLIAQGRPSRSHLVGRHGTWRTRLRDGLHRLDPSRMGLYVYAILFTMLVALLLSRSRGALASLPLALLATLVLVLVLRGRRTEEARLLPALVATALIAGALFAGSSIKVKLDRRGFQDETRHELRDASYGMISDYPLFGCGSGNWQFLHPSYKNPLEHFAAFDPRLTDHAHNDHLELLAEQGVIGYLLVGGAIVLALRQMAVGLRQRRDPLMRGILFGCMAATISLLLHAWVEFNFHIPANATWFYVVLALGLVASRRLEPT